MTPYAIMLQEADKAGAALRDWIKSLSQVF
jgi:hypothetical protein